MTKRELFIMNPFETEGLVQYLEKKKEEGWGLSKLGYFYLYFEKQENANYNYAVDLVNHSDNDLGIYLDFMDTTGWTKIGNRGGIYVFKSETESQFYSDQIIDRAYHSANSIKETVIVLWFASRGFRLLSKQISDIWLLGRLCL